MANKTKDSYDELLQFSRITQDSWMLADRKDHVPFDVEKKDWVKPFLEPCLKATMPWDGIKVFEIARASMIYSWFFYPLATSAAGEPRWQAMRRLRNDRSHVKGFVLIDPVRAAGVLHVAAELINKLFSNSNKPPLSQVPKN